MKYCNKNRSIKPSIKLGETEVISYGEHIDYSERLLALFKQSEVNI